MKIAFFGAKKFSDYYKIGGFESFIRRLATGLINSDNQVEYILYDSPADSSIEVLPNLTVRYFQDFAKASHRLLRGSYDHVFRSGLYRAHRLKYLLLQRSSRSSTKWHHLFLFWPDSSLKRLITMIDGLFSAPNGVFFCVSPRQYRAISRFHQNTCHIFPPVPEKYFVSPENRKINEKIHVTFLGNLTHDKFIEEVINLFQRLHKSQKFHFVIFGTHDHLNRYSVAMHERLQLQDDIQYVHIDLKNYSAEVDLLVANILKDTDVFVQPYRTLKNTLDTPLLLLEAMAALCAVITTPLGSVPDIYGQSRFLLPLKSLPEQAENLLKSLTWEDLQAERNRIFKRNQELDFHLANVLKKMKAVLENS
jgi:glycosyltransferase involved in cell wall biosynthesis